MILYLAIICKSGYKKSRFEMGLYILYLLCLYVCCQNYYFCWHVLGLEDCSFEYLHGMRGPAAQNLISWSSWWTSRICILDNLGGLEWNWSNSLTYFIPRKKSKLSKHCVFKNCSDFWQMSLSLGPKNPTLFARKNGDPITSNDPWAPRVLMEVAKLVVTR